MVKRVFLRRRHLNWVLPLFLLHKILGTNNHLWGHGIQWGFFAEILTDGFEGSLEELGFWWLWPFETVIQPSLVWCSFSYCQFSCSRAGGEMKLRLASWLCFKADWASPCSPGLRLAGPLNLTFRWYACPVFRRHGPHFTCRSIDLTTWMLFLEWSPHPEASWLQLGPESQNSGAWIQGEGLKLLA